MKKVEKLGATGKFPEGQLNKNDEGELKIGITKFGGNVIIDFGKQIAWIGFSPDQAIELAKVITRHAIEIKFKKDKL